MTHAIPRATCDVEEHHSVSFQLLFDIPHPAPVAEENQAEHEEQAPEDEAGWGDGGHGLVEDGPRRRNRRQLTKVTSKRTASTPRSMARAVVSKGARPT